jgi:uncharacterized small protein (DUF1192 family)
MDDVEMEEVDEMLATIGLLKAENRRLEAEVERIKAAIREHRDQKGDDRCWLDDLMLYRALDGKVSGATVADMELPPKCDFLESCSRYWDQRQRPTAKDDDPKEMTIAQLQAEVERLKASEKEAWEEVLRLANENAELLQGRWNRHSGC